MPPMGSGNDREGWQVLEDESADAKQPVKPSARVAGLIVVTMLACLAVGRLSAPAAAAIPENSNAVALEAEVSLPDGVKEGLQLYEELFTSCNPAMVPKVLHPKFSMTYADPPDSLSYAVQDFESMKEFFGMFQAVRSGEKSIDIVPADLRGFAKPFTLYNAYPTMRHYPLGENIHVTEINDKVKLADGSGVGFYTNLHWIKTEAGWRIIDKIYSMAP
mmetsp:Transcript_13278/g.24454  ORF Transcript_13278/g.24454 Transcript_13278/m.24454 type:complete len:218 (+) Transcript_13278:37-690(+)